MKNFIQHGSTLTFVAAAAIASGEGVVLGSGLFGVSAYDVDTGEEGEAHLEGVYELPKLSTDTPAAWAKAYWDADEKHVTTLATENTLVGVFVKAYGTGTTTAQVKLVPNVV